MKSKPLIITILLILVVLGGVWLYQISQSKNTTGWNLISKDAAVVLEVNKYDSFIEKFAELPNSKLLLNSSKSLQQLTKIQGHKTYIALFPTASDDFELMIYVESGASSASTLENLKTELGKVFTVEKRLYNGIEIVEFVSTKATQFSVALVDDILLVSQSSFLLEGAIKLRNGEANQLFKNANIPLYKLPTLQSDEGNVYLNAEHLIEFTSVFLDVRDASRTKLAQGSALTDLKINGHGVLVNGFLLNSGNSAVSLFDDQRPQPIDIESVVSNRVAYLTHFGFSDSQKWFEAQVKFVLANKVRALDSLDAKMKDLSIDTESIRKSIGNQAATCYLSKGNGKVSMLKIKESAGEVTIFDEIASKIAESNKDSLYLENYSGYSIKLIDYKNFLNQLLYPIAPPAEQCFFVKIGSILLFSENVELLKAFIDDIDSENTWGKSVEWNKFFGSAIQESNINLFFDGKLLSVALREKFNKKWRLFFDSTNFLFLDKGSIQLSRLESNYYLNSSFNFSEREPVKANRNFEKTTYQFSEGLITAAAIVTNHTSKGTEVIVQDSANNLYLLSRDLKILWKEAVGSRIVDNVKQLDYYANNKLQYFLTSKTDLLLIDRLGRNVDGFPKKLQTAADVEYSAVIDYDKSKRYRYLITDVKGNLYLTDKEGVSLDGWNPLSLNGRLISSARHYRVLGKDYFIAILQSGTVHLLNRRGEKVKGFPIELGFRPSSDATLTVGPTLSATYFTIVSEGGVKVQFGLDGQLRKNEILLKRIGASQFSLVKSKSESSSVILRVDPSKITVIDADDQVIFEIENTGSTQWKLSFVENRLKERFYCLYDRQQNFSYFLDEAGKQLLTQPLESSYPPSFYFDEKTRSLMIFNSFEKSLSAISVKR